MSEKERKKEKQCACFWQHWREGTINQGAFFTCNEFNDWGTFAKKYDPENKFNLYKGGRKG